MTLTLISADTETHHVYEDADGNEILLAGVGPLFRRVVMWDDYDVTGAWRSIEWPRPSREAFEETVRQAVADPDEVSIVWCEDCLEPSVDDGSHYTIRGHQVCEDCAQGYYSCSYCDELVAGDDTTSTLHDDLICDYCRDRWFGYCEECDGYYHQDYADEHAHGGCDCAPPTLGLTMPNGDAVVTEDERFTASLPSGVISEEGMNQIRRVIQNHGQAIYEAAYQSAADAAQASGNSYHEPYRDPAVKAADEERGKWWNLAIDVPSMDPRWQTKEGNFTKRLSKLAHKTQGLKVTPDLMTKVGNIGRDNSSGADFAVELTRDLNLPAEEFYHEDSCWWQSYSESRCSLKSNGGIGMRTFVDRKGASGYRYSEVTGRAWIMPLRADEDGALQPTFDGQAADAYMVFNGYGDLSGYAAARIVAGMAGMTYRKINFDCPPMYVNNGNGYLVTSEEIAAKYPAGSRLRLYVDSHSSLYRDEESRLLVGV